MASSRDWRQARRARTRLLIAYGGLVVKAGLADLVDDDRATLLGAFLGLRDQLTGAGDEPADTYRLRYRRRGLRTFDADAAARKAGGADQGAAGESRGNASGGDRKAAEAASPG